MRPPPLRLLLVLLMLVLVNAGPVYAAWTDHRLDDGTTVSAAATARGAPTGQLNITLPPEVAEEVAEPGTQRGGLMVVPARVDPETYDRAVASGELEVTYLSEDPATYRVEGTERGTAVTAILIVNAGLLLIVGLYFLIRGRRRPELRLVATADPRRVPPGALLERVQGNDYVVRGEIESLTEEELMLQVGDRRVRVLLDGHSNSASYQHSVEVRGTMIG